MINKKESRIGSLDILRIVLCLFVITLHFNNSGGGQALTIMQSDFFSHEFSLLMESLTIGAVNGFMILSGYFLINSNSRNIFKPIVLVLTVMLYSSFFSLANMFITNEFSIKRFLHSLIPINYFVWIYIAVYLLSPWINIIFESISKKHAASLLLLMFVIFSVYPSIVDIYSGISGTTISGISTISSTDSGAGYTFVNFVFMYCIGAYVRKFGINLKKYQCIIGYLIVTFGILLIINFTMNGLYYSNPLVILSALFLFLVFEKSKLPSCKVTTILSSCTFSIFIIHCQMYFIWKAINVEKMHTQNLLLSIGAFIVSVLIMYICSAGVALLGKVIVYPGYCIMKKYIKFSYKVQRDKV